MSKDVLHVVPQEENWAVKREGNERASSVNSTQKEAIDSARGLAHEGDSIVIHRPDGTIRDRITYTEAQTKEDVSNTPVRPRDVQSVGSRVSIQAILAGLAVTVTVYLCFTLLCVAIGISTMDYIQSRTFAIGAAIVGLVSLLGALFVGGFVVSRLSTRETVGEAAIYGVLLWAALLFTILLTGMNLGGSFSQMAQVVRPPAAEVRTAEPTPEELARAEKRRELVLGRGEELLSRMDPAVLAWWAFGGMLLSVLAAVAGSITGCGPEVVFRRRTHDEPQRRTEGTQSNGVALSGNAT